MTPIEAVGTLLGANFGAIIFAAGIIYNKVNKLEEEVKKYNGHSEKIAVLQTEVKHLKEAQ